MRAKWTMAAAAAALAALSGCAMGPTADQQALDNQRAQQAQTDRMLQQHLAEATAKIGARLETIERLERGDPAAGARAVALTQTAQARAMSQVSDPLQTRVHISWNGPADELLRRLASQMGARYRSEGVSPNLFAQVDSPNASAQDVLASVGQQLDGKADVIYDQNARVLTLRARD